MYTIRNEKQAPNINPHVRENTMIVPPNAASVLSTNVDPSIIEEFATYPLVNAKQIMMRIGQASSVNTVGCLESDTLHIRNKGMNIILDTAGIHIVLAVKKAVEAPAPAVNRPMKSHRLNIKNRNGTNRSFENLSVEGELLH